MQLCRAERSVDRGFDAHDGSACLGVPEAEKAAIGPGGGEPSMY